MLGSFGGGFMMFGSPLGARLLPLGRLKVLWLASFVGLVGAILQQVLQKHVFMAGRILYGVGTGMFSCAIPRYMDEILPPNLMPFFGGLYTFTFSAAVITAFMLALGLPPDHIDDEPNPALKDNEYWRVIYGLPILFYIF